MIPLIDVLLLTPGVRGRMGLPGLFIGDPGTAKTARLEARLPTEVYAMLKRAAEIEGHSLSGFVVAAASSAARQTIESAEMIRLGRTAQEQPVDLLLNPPAPNTALKKAFATHRELIGK